MIEILQAENGAKIDFEKAFGDRRCAGIIEPPFEPVRQKSPAQAAIGKIVDPAHVAQDLGGRRGDFTTFFLAAGSGPTVQRPKPSLAFKNCSTKAIAPPFFRDLIGLRFGLFVNEEESVRDIAAPGCGEILLDKKVAPAKGPQDRPD